MQKQIIEPEIKLRALIVDTLKKEQTILVKANGALNREHIVYFIYGVQIATGVYLQNFNETIVKEILTS